MLHKRPTWNRPWLIQWLNSTFKSRSAWVFSCLNASRYPPPHPVLWLRDRTNQPPSYLTLDLWSCPSPSSPFSASFFLLLPPPPPLGNTLHPWDAVEAASLKRFHAGTSIQLTFPFLLRVPRSDFVTVPTLHFVWTSSALPPRLWSGRLVCTKVRLSVT